MLGRFRSVYLTLLINLSFNIGHFRAARVKGSLWTKQPSWDKFVFQHIVSVVLCLDTKGLIFQLGQCISDGYNVKWSFVCALEEVFRAFTIANHFTMLHPSFCQHPNVLDLYNLGPERKVTQTKQSFTFTTCQIFNLSCTSLLFSVTTILRGFVTFEWQEMAYGLNNICVWSSQCYSSHHLITNTLKAVVVIDIYPYPFYFDDRRLHAAWQYNNNWHCVIQFYTHATLMKADAIDFTELRNQQLRRIVLLKCISCIDFLSAIVM